jgi:hypothetical protein
MQKTRVQGNQVREGDLFRDAVVVDNRHGGGFWRDIFTSDEKVHALRKDEIVEVER